MTVIHTTGATYALHWFGLPLKRSTRGAESGKSHMLTKHLAPYRDIKYDQENPEAHECILQGWYRL